MKTKALSLFLVLALLVSLVPMTALASDSTECDHIRGDWAPNGDGTHTSACKCGQKSVTNNCYFGEGTVCLSCKGDKPCDHKGTYTSNGNLTHTFACRCGKTSIGPDPCQEDWTVDGVCYICQGSMVCDHVRNDWAPNGDGTHTSKCHCGQVSITNNCNPGSGTTCLLCGGDVEVEPECTHSVRVYNNNNDGTHTVACYDCPVVFGTEEHSYNEFDTCVCRAIKPAEPAEPECDHTRNDWAPNGDGTHTSECDCGKESVTYDCVFGDDDICNTCKGTNPCDHIRNDWAPNGDGTHTSACDCGQESVTNNCNPGSGTTCLLCGGDVEVEPECTHGIRVYNNNNDGTHTISCYECPVVFGTEEHSYNEFDICICRAIKPAEPAEPECDHTRNDWAPNGDGTHTSECDCGKESVTYNCLFGDDDICRTCKGIKPCDHVCDNWSSNGDGTHSASCDCGENKVGPYDCQPLLAGGSTCHTCGADMPAKPVCQHEYHGAVNNYNGTHNIVCSDCATPLYTEAHSYNAYDVCVCGAIKPVCQHKNHEYVNNGANHTVACDDCNKPLYTEDHDFSESGTCVCGAAEPKCDHKRPGHSIVNNGDGTHSTLCTKCKAVLHTEAHSFSDLHNCGCGAVKPFYVPEVEEPKEDPYYPDDAWNRLDELFVTFK